MEGNPEKVGPKNRSLNLKRWKIENTRKSKISERKTQRKQRGGDYQSHNSSKFSTTKKTWLSRVRELTKC